MERQMSNSGEFRRYDGMKISFDTIVRSLEHEDAKANRLMVAMAFITVASAAIFVGLYTPETSAWQLGIAQMAWVALFFYIYLGLVLLGTLFIMAALGPRLNLPREWPGDPPLSRLFFQKIAEMPREEWKKHMLDTPVDKLEELITGDLAFEAHLLAQKNSYKVFMMGIGRDLYRYSFVALIAFVALCLTHSIMLGFGVALLSLSVIIAHHAFEVSSLSENLTQGVLLTWRGLVLNLWRNIGNIVRVRVMTVVGIVLFVFSLSMICLDLAS